MVCDLTVYTKLCDFGAGWYSKSCVLSSMLSFPKVYASLQLQFLGNPADTTDLHDIQHPPSVLYEIGLLFVCHTFGDLKGVGRIEGQGSLEHDSSCDFMS